MQHAYTSSSRFRSLLGLALGLAATAATAQTVTPVSFNGTAAYTQNFDGMGTAGVTYPAGWGAVRLSGTGAANTPLDLSATIGDAISGGVYNVGSNNDPDRALGSIASGSTVPAFGAAFTNGSSAAVTSLTIAFRTEQWKSGSALDITEVLAFEYSLDATSLSTGTWTAVPALNVIEVANSNTGGTPLDGNAAANSANVTAGITGLNWAAGRTMWIRFKDTNDGGTDALLAVDNFSLRSGTTTSTSSALKAGNVLVYPNPTADQLTIRVAGRATKAAVTVTDLLGRTVLKGTATAEGTFSLRSLPAGNYVVLVQDGETLTSHKVSKQ
ncbi:T9SS type A sorting domain-containing protein [Hymenobacter psychrophilus]|uniref:Por secretion system C-terminal sorting domain-containing protein n=1 Tax=Hymenobacter psychrophilus TaxID=651662 RepID=A0A1H3H0C8_9BACT|nr:T9SS type A sorting domain-containing protein [Hymenobacter psychrophilus]SDY08204.1 Por secretion system C-terminal sorting domain-containing protein [Hymenobacter psychrophilus]